MSAQAELASEWWMSELLFIGSTPLSQVEAVVAQDIRVLDGEE